MVLRVLIVDDNAHFLEAARELLEREGLDVVGVAGTAGEALERVRELQPEVTLVDIELGGESGFDLAGRLSDGPDDAPRVILISTYTEQDFRDLIDASPVIGFVSKSDLSAQAILAILAHPGGEGDGEGRR